MSSVSNKVVKKLMSAICFILPKAFKRLVVISTLYREGQDQHIFQYASDVKMNRNMNIASNQKAIESAVHLKDAVWRGIDLHELIKEASTNQFNGECVPNQLSIEDLTDRVVAKIPAWVRYNPSEMRADIRKLFSEEAIQTTM